MKIYMITLLLRALVLLWSLGSIALNIARASDPPTVVLQDNFNSGVLDPAKWLTSTPYASSSVYLTTEGQVVSENRGHLTSKGQWNPGPTGVGTLSVTGRFRLLNEGIEQGDMVLVAIRSSGVPRDSIDCGACKDCIEFGLSRMPLGPFGYVMWMDLHTAPNKDSTLSYRSFMAGSGWYWFKVEDDGYNIRVWCNETGDFSGSPDLQAATDYSFTSNHISFYGRNHDYGYDHTTYFDDVTVSVAARIPSVSQSGLIILAVFMVGTTAWMVLKRRARLSA